ncbi:unnamed protein product [Rotaria magnacalcarata]|uniref:Uncharacterized protein n=1 Tax=Rotaria magnacalcarata TaxID=392030 RepID=A0A815S5K2_9BILA|nr:unnamed protein product [Rotaria magnacalcarata]CAF1487850.1 unnamed protein product [Rotaria magnacalcarata]CAF3783642.1 unnamed protein product [Rotaria magnacalcarata]CAF3893528.1 unnamed protein product [Rotaria magnacalcarata]
MKLKEYFSSLVSRRKSNASSKSHKPKAQHQSISSADCHYEICGYEETNNDPIDNRYTRTEMLLTRHAQLVNTIIGMRSQENMCSTSCSNCRLFHPVQEPNIYLNRHYSSTLATCKPSRECQNQAIISSSNTSISTKTRQRSRIRTNPWIQSSRISKPEHSLYEPTSLSTLIHSESFPQTISNGNIHAINQSNIKFHQSDSGHGFSLSSSRAIDSSSSPDNTSIEGILFDEKQNALYTNQTEPHFHSKTTMSSDNRRKMKKSAQARFQRSSNTRISTSPKRSVNQNHHSHSSSPRLSNDHFSIEFEEIVENAYPHKQQSPTRKSSFILPLGETNVKSVSSLSILCSPPVTNLIKTNSRTILRHIEEIENEIRMIKNLNFDDYKSMDLSIADSKEGQQQTMLEEVDQWVENVLATTENNSPNLLHTECNHLSNMMKDYVACVCSNDIYSTSLMPKSQSKTEIMTAFYISTIPAIKQVFSYSDQSLDRSKSQTIRNDLKFIYECPF